ncbi:hypothetical protein KI811_07170 [Geobacter hydrogenophilus]|uniref:Response regulatory domain-containing protein n=1 Tax=Geobacter hydrogenophilus TaxID=40983 RepID=A0A9W6FZL0_9BACT|nr:hypothetical protein [Geobacter hydrogenophilus]MBT0893587.1 hypothetical protein [Geobacter hydrogenophilus]GLI37717.1 hypothetical protein GHYDROH2_12180 [Geobacter hydrogenophilus]
MVKILLIADQDRLEKLFDFVSDSPQIHFRISRSLRQGSQDIADEAPDILFVQNHLSGLSGEIIARHLIGQVEGVRPQVVLFGEMAQQPPDQGPLDACLDIARTDEELTAAVIGIISELPAPPPPVEIPSSVEAEEQAPAPSPTEQPVTASPATDAEPSITEPPIPATDTVVDTFGRQGSPVSPFDEKLATVIEQTAEPVPLAEMEDTVSLTAGADVARPSASTRPRIGRKETKLTKLIWIGLAALAVVAVGTIMLLTPETPSPKQALRPAALPAAPAPKNIVPTPQPPAPAAPPTAAQTSSPGATAPAATPPKIPAQPQPQRPPQAATPPQPAVGTGGGLAQLPSFVPREGHDRDYGKSHPGWERYKGARTEFKVYREGTVIRAVQAIDRSGVGIPESFLRGALSQMSTSREFTLDSTETQGKFRVEKGTVKGGGRLVVYRTVPKGAIRAFVVHFN